MKNTIQISSLTIGYNQQDILKDINLTAESGKLIAIFGRNGQGKSTLIKTISGLLPAISGSVMFNEMDLLQLDEKEKSRLISIVSTAQFNIGGITVNDYVGFGRFPYTNWLGINTLEDVEFINNAIEMCNIISLKNRKLNELSDGEKQKVNIARALAQKTPIIMLDEPTVHLDLNNKIEVFKLLKTITESEQKTIIISTHQIEFAMQICDEIWLINNGKIESLTPTEIIEKDRFNEVFNDELISYDKLSNSFRLK